MRLISMRFRICLLLLFGLSASVCMRSHFSMTLVCMLRVPNVSQSESALISTNIYSSNCPQQQIDTSKEGDDSEPSPPSGDLEWPRDRTPYLFTIVLVGQVASLLLSMHLANLISPKKMMLYAVLSQVLITFLSPSIARISYWAFFVSRFAIGFAEGLVFSPVSAIATRWFPPNERASMVALYTSSFQIAFGIAPFLVSIVCSSRSIFGGWPPAFYLFGLLGLLWSIEWLRVGSDDPSSNKYISEKEVVMLEQFMSPRHKHSNLRPPYAKMFTSPVMFAHIISMMAFYFTLGLVSSFLPLYFQERLQLSIKKNGLFTMIPFIAMIGMKNGIAFGMDAVKRRGHLGHTVAAKINQTTGCIGSSISLAVLLYFTDCTTPGLALIAMTCCCAFHSCCAIGFYASMLHICPPLTGVIASIVTCAGVIASGASTALMGIYAESPNKYEHIFGLCILLNVLAGIIYLIWGTAEVQPWVPTRHTTGNNETIITVTLNGNGEEGGSIKAIDASDDEDEDIPIPIE